MPAPGPQTNIRENRVGASQNQGPKHEFEVFLLVSLQPKVKKRTLPKTREEANQSRVIATRESPRGIHVEYLRVKIEGKKII